MNYGDATTERWIWYSRSCPWESRLTLTTMVHCFHIDVPTVSSPSLLHPGDQLFERWQQKAYTMLCHICRISAISKDGVMMEYVFKPKPSPRSYPYPPPIHPD